MQEQLTLLRETDWDVLVILDACRADAFDTCVRDFRGPFQVVRSPAPCTELWIQRVGPLLAGLDVTYFSANPVVDRTVQARRLALRTVPIWEKHWGRFTELQIPSVHPLSVTAVAVTWIEWGKEAKRYVVHYVQPHSPYIGAVPLNLARCGRGGHPLFAAMHALARPDHEVKAGRITWPEVREAYLANLSLAWAAVRMLAAALPDKRFVVTSDHGEMLGEDGGKFGHECNWRNEELFRVPWLEATGAQIAGAEQDTTLRKLEALGYT